MINETGEASFGAKIVKHLEHNGLKVTPAAFELWYEYLAGVDTALKAAVNAHIDAKTLSDAIVVELHGQFVRDGKVVELVERSSQAVMLEIEGIADLIRTLLGSSNAYSSTLSSLLGDMVTVNDAAALRRVVETLVEATEDARTSTSLMEKRLEAAQSEMEELRGALEATRAETLQDALTGVSNRKHFEQAIRAAIETSELQNRGFTLLMIDIDHFKNFNDTHGHLIGDKVLRVVANALKEKFRGRSTVARFGGEEFAVILPDTDLMAGWVGAEAVRQMIVTRELVKRSTGEKLGRITVSIGVGAWRRHDTSSSLIARADAALLRAKHSGRNRTITEDKLSEGAAA